MSEEKHLQPNSENSQEKPVMPSKKLKLPDWQPLGTVRDSFYEQMKQDHRS